MKADNGVVSLALTGDNKPWLVVDLKPKKSGIVYKLSHKGVNAAAIPLTGVKRVHWN
ncbi:MAG: hypothetical protein LBP54_03970 [Campylobacteraceae bacterium]|jgi:hypothetical protein|nr:hypothetical protein [Campylobacteraceae bacterium]